MLGISLLFMLGVSLYVFALLSIFGLEFYSSGIGQFAIIMLALNGGLTALLGYVSVIILGGYVSLRLTEFIARLTRSRHVIEVVDESSLTISHKVALKDFLLYMPALIFILSVLLAWDIHNLHDPRTSIFHPLLRALIPIFDVFSVPAGVNPTVYSVDVIPAMVVIVAIAGATPSMVLPYFRRFKITGVNSGPFHTNLLATIIGLVAGLGALLTLLGFIYRILWVGKGPYYYHYILLAIIGLSLHYTIGASLGRNRSEDMVINMLRAISGKRVIRGTVNIQEPSKGSERKPS